MNKKLAILTCILLAVVISLQSMVFAAGEIKTVAVSSGLSFVIGSVHYTNNGVRMTMDVAPYIKSGRTYLPVRYVGEALGAEVGWEDSTSSVTLAKDGILITLRIGSTTITVNGQSSSMDVAPELTAGRTCLPIRFVAEALGQTVGWDATNNAVIITKDAASQPKLGTWYTPSYPDQFSDTIRAFKEGYFVGYRPPAIASDTYNVAVYKDTMELVTVTPYTTFRDGFSEGLLAVGFQDSWSGDLLGYMDTAGNEVIKPKYIFASSFLNGLAVVIERNGNQAKTKVINKKEEVQFEFDGEFHGRVYEDGIYFGQKGLYDYQGKPGSQSNSAAEEGRHIYYDEGRYERHVITGYSESEKAAFEAEYGHLYGPVDYVGHGLFKVGHISMKLTETSDYDKVYAAQQKRRFGVVDKNNNVIIPMREQHDIVPHHTESSVYFVVNMESSYKDDDPRSAVYNATGQKLLNDGYFYVWYAPDNAIYYVKPGNQGWGLMSLTGNHIVPYSKNLLIYIDDRGQLSSFSEYASARSARITFYTTANMQQRADTTRLRALVTEATDIAKRLASIPDTGMLRTELNTAITNANRVLSSPNPIWIDVSSLVVRLLYIANMAYNAVTP